MQINCKLLLGSATGGSSEGQSLTALRELDYFIMKANSRT